MTWKRLRGPAITIFIVVVLTGLWVGHNYVTYRVAHIAVAAPQGVSKAVKRIRTVTQNISFHESDSAFNAEVENHPMFAQGFVAGLAAHAQESFFHLLINEPWACIRLLSENGLKNMSQDSTTEGPPAKMAVIGSLSPLLQLKWFNYRSLVLMLIGAAWLWRKRKYRLLAFATAVVLYFAVLGAFAFDNSSRIFYPAQMAGSILIACPIVELYGWFRSKWAT
jgi:hypothetical protein